MVGTLRAAAQFSNRFDSPPETCWRASVLHGPAWDRNAAIEVPAPTLGDPGRRTPTHLVCFGIGSDAATTIGELLAALSRARVAVTLPRLAEQAARPAVLRSFALVVHDVLASRIEPVHPGRQVRSGSGSDTVLRVTTAYGRECQRSRRSSAAGGLLSCRSVRRPGLAVVTIGDLEA